MSVHSSTDFLTCLKNSDLLSPGQLQALQETVAADRDAQTPEALAESLVQQKQLTQWQATQLLKGQTGFVLHQYRLLNPIGRGGMGHVFRARDSRSGQVVAIKVMAKSLLSNQTLVARFRREIKASSRLNSPHIVRSLNAGKVGTTDFMVMEYVNGDQVDRVAARLQTLPTGLATEVIRQAAVGLQHAHECGMVHRDIKPANLMIHWNDDGSGTVRLMDMGLVRLTEDSEADAVTRAGQVMGTPDYMSPEQGWDTSKVDIRSDIYSLGCACYRLLTGTIPFSGANPLQVLSQRLQRDAPSIRAVRPELPEELAVIICRMTTRDPANRYQSPREVAEALAPFCEPLTRSALRSAAKSAGLSSETLRDPEESSSNAVEFSNAYHQFLRDMQESSNVDLVAETPTASGAVGSTLPTLQIEPRSYATEIRRGVRSGPQRGQLAGFIMLGIASLILVLVALFLLVFPEG